MPIFEYKCDKCGAQFENLVKNADEKVVCSKCGSKKVVKQLSSFSASVKEGGNNSCSVSSCSTCCPSGTCGL
jgi:putative FmdB family regulatory protein